MKLLVSKITRQPEPHPSGCDCQLKRDGSPRYVVDANGCWIWNGYKNYKGYGQINLRSGGTPRGAHCWMYEHFIGPVPIGLQLDHLCRVRACVNPAHLEPVTAAENQQRGSRPRFTADEVRAMRSSPRSCNQVARQFGTDSGTVSKIRRGLLYASIEDEVAAA